MTQVFACPGCQKPFQVPDDAAGQTFECPSCGAAVVIPGFEASEEEPSVSPAEDESPAEDDSPTTSAEVEQEDSEDPPAPPIAEFEPQPVDHLLPPRFDIPDPARFRSRLGSSEVILPDGQGGYQSVDANIVTITHQGEVYHLKRLSPQQRRRRKAIHSTIAIGIAIVLIYLTLKTLGIVA